MSEPIGWVVVAKSRRTGKRWIRQRAAVAELLQRAQAEAQVERFRERDQNLYDYTAEPVGTAPTPHKPRASASTARLPRGEMSEAIDIDALGRAQLRDRGRALRPGTAEDHARGTHRE